MTKPIIDPCVCGGSRINPNPDCERCQLIRERDFAVVAFLWWDVQANRWRVGNPRQFRNSQAERLYAIREYLRREDERQKDVMNG